MYDYSNIINKVQYSFWNAKQIQYGKRHGLIASRPRLYSTPVLWWWWRPGHVVHQQLVWTCAGPGGLSESGRSSSWGGRGPTSNTMIASSPPRHSDGHGSLSSQISQSGITHSDWFLRLLVRLYELCWVLLWRVLGLLNERGPAIVRQREE